MTAVKVWRFFGVGMLAVAAALLAGSWSLHDTASPARAQGADTVQVGDDVFSPQTITVPVGTTVTWEVMGTHGHTVTSDTGVFDSGPNPMMQGDTFSFTFNQVGTFPYFCMFHGGPGDVGMSGTVVVTAAQEPTPTPAPTAMPGYVPPPTAMPAAAPTPAPAATPAAPSGAATGSSITVTLGPGRDGSQPGTAMLTPMGNQTEVDISITPGAAGVPQPVHIHSGTCDNLGAVVYPLTNIVDGKSMTLVNASLSSLQTGDFAINAHLSQAGINTYVSCGNIPASTAAGQGSSITVTLGPGRDASQPGTAMLMAMGNQTEVDISITPGAAGVPQPVHIHAGTCDNLGAVVYPLTNIVDGKSMTLVNASLSSLQTGDFAINAHLSQTGINTYVSCGTIPASTAAGQTAPASKLPAAGSVGLQGGYGGSGVSAWWYALGAAGAVLLLSGATILWRVRVRK